MIYTLPTFSLCLWFAVAASLLFLSSLLMVGGYGYKYPRFTTLIHFTTCGCTVLLLTARFWDYHAFTWIYFTYRVAWDVLAAMAAREVYMKVFGPSWSLPPSVPRSVAVHLAMVVTAAAAVSVALHATTGNMALRYGATAEGALYGALAGLYFVLFCVSRKRSITWHWRIKHIAGGMALILVVNTLATFFRGHLTGMAARGVDDAGQAAYLIAFVFWSCHFLACERPAPSRNPEILTALSNQLREARSRAEAMGMSPEGH